MSRVSLAIVQTQSACHNIISALSASTSVFLFVPLSPFLLVSINPFRYYMMISQGGAAQSHFPIVPLCPKT